MNQPPPTGPDYHAALRLAAIVESSADAIVSKDLNGIIVSWNRAAERMFGYTAEEAVGRSITMIIPADRLHEEDRVLSSVRRGEKVDHFETVRRRKDGSLLPISLTVSPIRDAGGVVIGASKIARDISDRVRSEEERARLLLEVRRQGRTTELLNDIGRIVVSMLERDRILQAVTDAATAATDAEYGAFFYNEEQAAGGSYQLYTLSGAARDAFERFPHPRATALFAPTFRGEGPVRIDDVAKDDRFGRNPPFNGLPSGHLPVASYLAVPVKARTGEVLGGLFFAHSRPGIFTGTHERLAEGIASWASVALENARLYSGLEAANRSKDEFLATLSHELRTPLNAILGYARMLSGGMLDTERSQRGIEVIERNAQALAQIVDDVLDVARITSGKLRLNVQAVALEDVVRDAVAAVALAADAKSVRITTRVAKAAGIVAGDPERLRQVLWNLLANAVKFTGRGGSVTIEVERHDAQIVLTVADTGIGIDAGFIPFLFDRFRQGDANTTREHSGLGLGLAIARQLVEMHGGTISAASPGAGQGATFTVTLPVGSASESSSRLRA